MKLWLWEIFANVIVDGSNPFARSKYKFKPELNCSGFFY